MSATGPARTVLVARRSGGDEVITLGRVVAEGGDARIWTVTGQPDVLAKMYRDAAAEPRRRAKLEAMLAAPPEGVGASASEVQFAWPVALIEDEEASRDAPPAGFLMPRVDLSRAALLEELLSARARRGAGLPDAVRFRVSVAANLAAVVEALHARGDHVVDLKPSNVHVYRDSGRVAVLDCDGFSIGGPDGARFPAHQYTDGTIAPEALRARAKPEALGEAQDRFALAVVVFGLLNRGLHPFQGVPQRGAAVPTTDSERVAAGLYPYGSGARTLAPPPASLYRFLDRETQRLFARAFDGSPADRPSATEWRRHLRALVDETLRRCAQSTDHARFGHQPCGLCAVRPRVVPPPPSAASRSSSSSRRQARAAAKQAPTVAAQSGQLSASAQMPTAAIVGILVMFGFLAGLLMWAVAGSSSSREEIFVQAAIRDQDLTTLARHLRTDPAATTRYTVSVPIPPLHYRPLDDALGYPDTWQTTTSHYPLRDLVPTVDGGAFARVMTPILHTAAYYVRPGAVQLIARSSFSADSREASAGRTPLMLAAANAPTPYPLRPGSLDGVIELGRLLADSTMAWAERNVGSRRVGAPPAPQATRLRRPLGLIEAGKPDPFPDGMPEILVANAAVVELLLRAGASLDAEDAWGRRPLAYAAATGNAATVRQLLLAGADPNAADRVGVTALMVAADQAATPRSDRTAFVVAAELLMGGANAGLRDLAGRTAADYVGERASTRLVKTQVLPGPFDRLAADDTASFDASRTAALLEFEHAQSGWLAADGLSRDSVWTRLLRATWAAPPRAIADLGDGATWAGGRAVRDAPAYARSFPRDTLITVSCDGVAPGGAEVFAVFVRDIHPGQTHVAPTGYLRAVAGPTWTTTNRSERRRLSADQTCREQVHERLRDSREYDLTGETDRWPAVPVRLEVLPVPRSR